MLGGTQRQGQWVSAAHAGRKLFNLKFKGNDFPANCGSHWISGKALGPDGLWCWGAQDSELSIGLGHGSTLRSQVFFVKTCYVQDDVYVVWRIVQGRWLIVEPSQMCVCVFMYCVYVHVCICAHASMCAYEGQWSASVIFLYSLLLIWVRVPHKHGDYSESLTSKSLPSAFLCP